MRCQRILVRCIAIGTLVFTPALAGSPSAQEDSPMDAILTHSRAVMIVAKNHFRDEELLTPKEYLEKRGCTVTVASTSMGDAVGMLGKHVTVDIVYTDIRVASFDLVVFVGGSGAACYFNDEKSHAIARETVETGRVLGAICIAPSTLARAGVLKGKKATCFPSQRDDLKEHGAVVSRLQVVRDGRIITGSGPEAAGKFAKALAEALGEYLKEKKRNAPGAQGPEGASPVKWDTKELTRDMSGGEQDERT